MQPSPENVPNLWKLMDSFQAQLGKVHESLTNPEQKQILGEVLGKLQAARVEAEKTVPASVKNMHANLKRMQEDNAELMARAKQAQEELEKKKQEQAKKPATPLRTGRKPTSTERHDAKKLPGTRLRDELLRHGETGQGRSADDEHEIWEDWVDSRDLTEQQKPSPPPAPQAEPPPPAEPEKKDEEEGWTTEW